MAYYLYEGAAAVGPFEPAELVRRPGFSMTTLVFPVGATTADAWKPAETFLDIAAALKLPPQGGDEFAPKLAAPAEKLILVVDDDENVRSFIEMSAKLQGFQVVTAVNGLDATAKLAQKPADLIVTDLMMPGQGGYEFLRSLQGASGPRVPVFVVTGSALDDSTVQLIRSEANVVEFVSKPIRVAPFVGALHKHLRTRPA